MNKAILLSFFFFSLNSFADQSLSVYEFEMNTVNSVESIYKLTCQNRQDNSDTENSLKNTLHLLSPTVSYNCVNQFGKIKMKVKINYSYSIRKGPKQTPVTKSIVLIPSENF